MKSVLLSLFLSGIIILGTISPIFAYIPPTNAYSGIITSNDTVLAPNYFSNATFQGLHGIQVFGSNNSQTIYFNATLSNGTVITPITCSNNYQLHSVSSGGVFTCAPNNSTGGSGSTLDTMQNLTPAQAYVFAKNNTNINFQFRGMNFTGSLFGSNSSNLITIHGNIYQNNTGSNLGTSGVGIFSSMSGSVFQFLKLIGGQGISVSPNSTNAIISTNFKVNNQTCSAGYFVSAYDNKTGNYICSQDSDPFLTAAILSINGNTNAAQIINASFPVSVVDSGSDHTIKCVPCITSAITSINSQVAAAMNINRGSVTNMSNIINGTDFISIQQKPNHVLTNGSYQDITKGLQIDKLNDTSKIVSGKDTTKAITFLNSGMTTGITTTIRNNATTSQGINIPATRETESLSFEPQTGSLSNSTTQTFTSLTTSYRMAHYPVSITPQITGNVRISLSTTISDSTATDGCSIELLYGTGTAPHSGQAVSGTLIGFAISANSATASANVPTTIIFNINGLTLGTDYWIEPGLETITGGTCSIKGAMELAQEY